MSIRERLHQIDRLLAGKASVSRQELEETLGISWATLKRDLRYMKNRLQAPIVFDRLLGGYRFGSDQLRTDPQYQAPNCWFSAGELHALLTMQQRLAHLDTGGLLGPHIPSLRARLNCLLGAAGDSVEAIQQRIHIEPGVTRERHLEHFQIIGFALMHRQRLLIHYQARDIEVATEWEVSPQRLSHVRDNWYLEAWCHQDNELRNFPVGAITAAELLNTPAQDSEEPLLDETRLSGYGITTGDLG